MPLSHQSDGMDSLAGTFISHMADLISPYRSIDSRLRQLTHQEWVERWVERYLIAVRSHYSLLSGLMRPRDHQDHPPRSHLHRFPH